MTMLAFHNDPKIKARYIKRMEEHARLDEITQGIYWENGKGCATGCLMHSTNPHKLYPTKLGIPETIAYLEDRIFEGLSNEEAKSFAVDFLKVIPVGADLSLVTPKFMVWLLVDKNDGVIRFADADGSKAIRRVATLYRRVIRGGPVSDQEWYRAARAARAAEAAAWAAEAAAWAAEAAAWAAEAAARAAEAAALAAEAAAWSAARAARAAEAAEAAARAAHYQKMRDKLLELLASAPVKEGHE